MLSKILRKLRENSGLIQQQVADILKIDRSTYAYYETGKTTPDIDTIIKLSKIFNVSYSDMLEDEERTVSLKVADIPFDEAEILLRYGCKNSYFIYELSRDEQNVIMMYRLLPKSKQEELVSNMSHQLEEENLDCK